MWNFHFSLVIEVDEEGFKISSVWSDNVVCTSSWNFRSSWWSTVWSSFVNRHFKKLYLYFQAVELEMHELDFLMIALRSLGFLIFDFLRAWNLEPLLLYCGLKGIYRRCRLNFELFKETFWPHSKNTGSGCERLERAFWAWIMKESLMQEMDLEEQVGVRKWWVYHGTFWAGVSMSGCGLGVSLACEEKVLHPPPKALLLCDLT